MLWSTGTNGDHNAVQPTLSPKHFYTGEATEHQATCKIWGDGLPWMGWKRDRWAIRPSQRENTLSAKSEECSAKCLMCLARCHRVLCELHCPTLVRTWHVGQWSPHSAEVPGTAVVSSYTKMHDRSPTQNDDSGRLRPRGRLLPLAGFADRDPLA